MNNSINLAKAVSNIEIVSLENVELNKVLVPVAEHVVKPLPHTKGYFLHFDLFKGEVRPVAFCGDMVHIDTNVLLDEMRRAWYAYEYSDIEADYQSISGFDAEKLNDADKKALEVIRARYDSIVNKLNRFTASSINDVGNTARTFVHAIRRDGETAFSSDIQDAANVLVTAIKCLGPSKGSPDTLNFKRVRECGDKLCSFIFDKTDAACNDFTFHCNHALAVDMWRVMYGGRKLDREGKVVVKEGRPKSLYSEVVLACIECLQEKKKEQDKKEEESK